MKKLFTLLTMLIVAITSSWADETLFNVDFTQEEKEQITTTASSATFVAKTYQGYDMSFGVKSGKSINILDNNGGLEFSGNNYNSYMCLAIPLTVTANKKITATITLPNNGTIKYNWVAGALPSSPAAGSGTNATAAQGAGSTTNTLEFTPTGTSCVLYLGRSGNSDSGAKVVSSIIITQESASDAPTTPTLTVDGGDVNGASTTTIASTNAQKIYYCWNNSSTAPAKDAEETWTEVTGNSYEYTIPNVTASGMYLHAYGWNTVNTSDIKTSNAFNVTKTKLDAGLEYAITALTKGVGDANFTNELTNPHNLDVTYSVEEGATATGVSVDENGEVTVGDVVGTATIKASFAGNDDYNADVATYVLTVAEYRYISYDGNGADSGDVPEQQQSTPGATVTTAKTAATLTKAGYTVVGWNTQADGQGTSYGFNSTFTMGSEDIILYAVWSKNYYKFTPKTVESDEPISTIGAEIINSTNGAMTLAGKKNDTSVKYTAAGLLLGGGGADSVRVALDANMIAGSVIVINMQAAGTGARGLKLNKDNKANVTTLGWSDAVNGEIATFTYTVTSTDGLAGKNWFCLQRSNSVTIKSVVVTNVNASITVGETGFATVGLPFATEIPEGVTAYAVESVTGSKVKMSPAIEAGTTIPANKGFVIVAAPNTYSFAPVANSSYEGTDILEATGINKKAATTDAPIYVLTITDATNKKIGFKKATSGSLGAYKAYLPGTVSNLTSLSASFDDDPTSVDAIAEANDNANSAAPVKVVKNGKLYIGNYNVAGQQVK